MKKNTAGNKQKTQSLLRNITVFVFLISLSPLLIMGLPSILSTSQILRDETINSRRQLIHQGALYIDLVMNDVESLIANLAGLEELNNALLVDSQESSHDKRVTQERIAYILNGYSNLKGLVSIDLFTEAGAHYHVGETLGSTGINTELRDRLFRETAAAGELVNWSGIEPSMISRSELPHAIIASKMLFAKMPGGESGNGLLVVSYDPAVFDPVFGAPTDQGSYTTVLDARHRIIFHPDSRVIGKPLSDDIVRNMDADADGYFQQSIDGQLMLVLFSNTQKGGWSVAEFVPLDSLMATINTWVAFLSVLFVFGVAGVLNFIRLIRKQVVQPIKKITETFKTLQSGDFHHADKLVLKNRDEIGDLGELFNSFIDAREDITTQKRLERQLSQQNQELQETLGRLRTTQAQMIQQEKLAGIGQLAAGVAHEINNPLGYVIANFGMAGKYVMRFGAVMNVVDRLRKGESVRPAGSDDTVIRELDLAWRENRIEDARTQMQEINDDIAEGLSRIAKIVAGLKSFSRVSQMEERGSYDLNQGIEETLLIANNELRYSADVQFQAGDIPAVAANGGQINQVLLNIMLNAVHAIKSRHGSEKGVITIGTCVEGSHVCCRIADNGCGMSQEVMKHVFEPFFTTKAVGQGTGLGLSIAYDIIVNKHLGKLEISSAPGEGSVFCLRIPIGQEADHEGECG